MGDQVFMHVAALVHLARGKVGLCRWDNFFSFWNLWLSLLILHFLDIYFIIFNELKSMFYILKFKKLNSIWTSHA